MSFSPRGEQLPPGWMAVVLEQPALAPPPGVKAHVTNRSGVQDALVVYGICCLIIATIFMAVRLYTNIFIVRRLKIADYFAILSLLLYFALINIGRYFVNEGAGVHQWNLQLKHLIEMLYWLNINQIVFSCTIVITKISILLQYLEIFAPNRTVNPTVWYGSWILIIGNVLCYLIIDIINNVACTPREKIWNPLIQTGHCIPNARKVNNNLLPIFNVISDITIWLLPASSIWKLRIPLKKKIGITLQLAIGILACSASITQLVFTIRMTRGPKSDTSYNAIGLAVGGATEILLGIIVSCTILFPKLFQAKGNKFRGVFSKFSRDSNSAPELPEIPEISRV